MKQAGTVIRVLPDGQADIVFARQGACESNCASCRACSLPLSRTARMPVPFPVSAGDQVMAELPGPALAGNLFLILTLPFLLFFSVWLLTTLLHANHPVLWSGGAFTLSVLFAVRRSRKRPVSIRLTPLSKED